ncbi:rRNA maturation RNase YbeY [Polynucleobacter paneuropaeus]|uniref:rRNA maturation RNase YbeY n=1 Tax=Polynucleobacter paneuropaeus TaxID=2527775 RepID=UPI001BFEB402|nr:rRNA maturation RNase YbeY [Polynucleobacter paneuropaeus]MBT8583587.1 rRNA maturation RNase YbeY [Polynucleobacter paneuropaeus]MBT8621290.1 rRNA maturation RNase YbeY [Polynucleobacter paneuropaeus]QWD12357.1 rRNA maturation RNase YbeY [Polynucleobacter paneuropaeus]QWD21243.1 rRNA maturation RNase YbeY [Polynucleobacter paneuropaeus]QWD47382.1 rRNA maturation RNase YbeY [Polynucleobacter paneuropaeus]
MSTKLQIDLQFASLAIESAINQIASNSLIKKWIKATTNKVGLITIRFVNAAEAKKMNAAYRKKDKPTNVLTFPYALDKASLNADIILCVPVIQKEAKEQGKDMKSHLAHLIIHGCLHAQGHDHGIPKQAEKMEALEIKLLKELGFANPYTPQ